MMTSWPFVNAPTTDLQYSMLFRLLQHTGIEGTVGDNTCKLTADSSGMTTFIAPGSAFIRGFYYSETNILAVNHDPSTSSPRVDRVVLRLDFNQTLPYRIQPIVLKGESGSNPSPPVVTQIENGVWELPLGRVSISAGSSTIGNNNIVDERTFIGSQLGQWTTSTRPTSPRKYLMGYNETINSWEFYNGTAWRSLFEGVSWSNITDKPSTSTLDGRTITVSDSSPTNADGNNGDIWLEY